MLVAAPVAKTTRFRFLLQKNTIFWQQHKLIFMPKIHFLPKKKYFLHFQISGQGENTSRAKIFS